MALILHGEGFCCFKNVRHHHRHNCHSHSPKHDQTYHNNNKMTFEYRPLIEDVTDKRGANNLLSSMLKTDRSSLEHSSGSDMIRRSSHTLTTGSNKIKEIIDLQNNDCHNIEINDEELPIVCSDSVISGVHGCISNGSAICSIHHYIHRDSSEHTPITSSDSEDLHDHHHHHRHALVDHLHGNHSHDLSPKNINMQAAVIHVIGDFIQSIGVFLSAVIIKYYVRFTSIAIDFSNITPFFFAFSFVVLKYSLIFFFHFPAKC